MKSAIAGSWGCWPFGDVDVFVVADQDAGEWAGGMILTVNKPAPVSVNW